jgi:hypothetical protein
MTYPYGMDIKKNNKKNYCASILASQSLSSVLSFEVSVVTCWGGSRNVGAASASTGASGTGGNTSASLGESKVEVIGSFIGASGSMV